MNQRTDAPPDLDGQWSQFRFEEAVLEAFAFLPRDYGFARAVSLPSQVVFEKPELRVSVTHNRASFELSAHVGPASGQEESYSVWEVARLMGAPEVDARTFLQASSPERVLQLVPHLAGTLKKYAASILGGDVSAFTHLRELRRIESSSFILEGDLAWARGQVEAAWHERDYDRVVRILGPHELHLSPAELKRLAYARKRLRNV